MTCKICGKTIDTYDVGAYRKFVDKSATEYTCRDCLASELGWTREHLEDMILVYRRRGCLLFPPLEENKTE